MNCPLCHGAKHVQRPQGWSECPCLVQERKQAARRSCGLAGALARVSWRAFGLAWLPSDPRTIAETAVGLRKSKSHNVILHGTYAGAEQAFALLLSEAIDASRQVAVMDVRALVDRAFAREDVTGPDPATVAVLGLRVGSEPKHSWNGALLERLLAARQGADLPTIISATRPTWGLVSLYGATGVGALLESFPAVRIDPRPQPRPPQESTT